MKHLLLLVITIPAFILTSCSGTSFGRSPMDKERERILDDENNLKEGKPLKHHKSETRLNHAKDDYSFREVFGHRGYPAVEIPKQNVPESIIDDDIEDSVNKAIEKVNEKEPTA